MLRFLNCSLYDFAEKYKETKIIFFGTGSWFQAINHTPLMALKSNFSYMIDNNPKEKVFLGDICLNVFYPEELCKEKDCVVILTSPVYMYDMFTQLKNLNLAGNVDCFAFPFMQMAKEKSSIDKYLVDKAINSDSNQKIPKVIHSFWFSGEKKPDSYKKCVDTWKEQLSNYKIIEWNLDNYDWQKHPFVKRAIELKAWAYASDYARLDVLNDFGGIYLDMDVEVFKPFDNLLGNDALFSFSNNVMVDLAFLGSRKNNPIIKKLLSLYDNVDLPYEKKQFEKFFQPSFVRNCLVENGIKMNGQLQILKEATVFSSEFFMPMDAILYKPYQKTDYTYCVHYDNFGWSFGSRNKHEKKQRDNNLLWNMIEGKGVVG